MVQGSIPKHMTQNIGDVDLSYLLYEGDGPVIMLMHGAGLFPWLWHPIARELAPRWRVIAPYFCDHREETDPEQGGLSWLLIAEDLARFCAELNLDKPGFVGHSMGGNVITMTHAEFGIKSRGLLLFEPIFFHQDLYKIQITVEQNPLALRATKRRSHWVSREELQEYVQTRPLFKTWDPEILELYTSYGMKEVEGGGLQLTCPKRREASMFMGGMKDDPWPSLSKVTCPTLIIEGDQSENRAFIDLKKVAAAIPQGIHRMISDEGHLLPLENPKLTRQIIEEFFGSL